jgi:hypothetical protein
MKSNICLIGLMNGTATRRMDVEYPMNRALSHTAINTKALRAFNEFVATIFYGSLQAIAFAMTMPSKRQSAATPSSIIHNS